VIRRLRVAIVARSVAPIHGVGGLERSVFDLLKYLASHDVDVTLITRPAVRSRSSVHGGTGSGSAAIDPRIASVFVPYRTFPFAGRRGTTVIDRSTAYPLFGMRAGRTALDLARTGQIDLVHGFGASVLGYARKRREVRAPLVLNPQGMEEFGATDPARARLKRTAYLPLRKAVLACAAAADRVIATDRALEPAVRQHLRVSGDRIRVIPNALDLPSLDSLAPPGSADAVRTSAGIGPHECVVLSVGRLEANKGFLFLASALAALRDHGSASPGAWRWVIVGDGPQRARIEQQVAASGISPNVVFAGRVDDRELHAWYEAATLFVHPTLYEGSSLVTLEAMAHRRAVIATTAGGIPDKVQHGVSGWLVPPGDAAALTGALSGALSDPRRLVGMGAAGRAIVEARFSWDAAGAATMRMYDELLKG